jgi:hypothetical protein
VLWLQCRRGSVGDRVWPIAMMMEMIMTTARAFNSLPAAMSMYPAFATNAPPTGRLKWRAVCSERSLKTQSPTSRKDDGTAAQRSSTRRVSSCLSSPRATTNTTWCSRMGAGEEHVCKPQWARVSARTQKPHKDKPMNAKPPLPPTHTHT